MFFFFSSRRRHTRSLCDWSSDVCSSDLLGDDPAVEVTYGTSRKLDRLYPGEFSIVLEDGDAFAASGLRSEERRVGKECRSRWARDRYKREYRRTRGAQ